MAKNGNLEKRLSKLRNNTGNLFRNLKIDKDAIASADSDESIADYANQFKEKLEGKPKLINKVHDMYVDYSKIFLDYIDRPLSSIMDEKNGGFDQLKTELIFFKNISTKLGTFEETKNLSAPYNEKVKELEKRRNAQDPLLEILEEIRDVNQNLNLAVSSSYPQEPIMDDVKGYIDVINLIKASKKKLHEKKHHNHARYGNLGIIGPVVKKIDELNAYFNKQEVIVYYHLLDGLDKGIITKKEGKDISPADEKNLRIQDALTQFAIYSIMTSARVKNEPDLKIDNDIWQYFKKMDKDYKKGK